MSFSLTDYSFNPVDKYPSTTLRVTVRLSVVEVFKINLNNNYDTELGND
jgi:hypothetical protein